jgi:hypothetical protein
LQSSSAPVTQGLPTVRSRQWWVASSFLLDFDKQLRISQQISTWYDEWMRWTWDGLDKATAASVLSTAPPSWVGSVCVKISLMNLQKRSKQQREVNSHLTSVSSRGKQMGTTTSVDYLYSTMNSRITKKDK